ncbi:phage tail protein, partial [Escherichia coli]
MMPVSCYLCIFLNVGLGGAAKLDAASASFGENGWLRLPVLLGTDKKTLIIQWAYGTAGGSNSTGLVCNFPFTFPNQVFTVMTGNVDQTYTSTSIPGAIGF